MMAKLGVQFMVDDETRKQLAKNQQTINAVIVGGIVIGSFDDIFAASEVEDPEKGIARQRGNAEDGRKQFEAAVDPESVRETPNGTLVGRDKSSGKVVLFRQNDTDPRSDATIEEQRTTETGNVRFRKVRFIPSSEEIIKPIEPTNPD
jgi:hypothetical protein